MDFRNSLSNDVLDILNLVEINTGKGVTFIENASLDVFAIVKIARSIMPEHIIYFNPNLTKVKNHLIAHECGHIFRLFKCEPNDRYSVAKTEENESIIQRHAKDIFSSSIDKVGYFKTKPIIDMLYDGLIKQVTNQPVDLMIEKWIYDSYPGLRSEQIKSLVMQNQMALRGIREAKSNMIPEYFVEKSSLMNMAYFSFLTKIIKYKFIRDWKKNIYYPQAKSFINILESNINWEPSFDREVVNNWAEFLELNKFFKWIPFELLPKDYLK